MVRVVLYSIILAAFAVAAAAPADIVTIAPKNVASIAPRAAPPRKNPSYPAGG
ncbi:hypothetical protein GGI21_004261, partial [Coemansia aciculifera]